MKLWLDTETYCDANLKVVGSYRYFEDPSFELLSLQYAIDDGPVTVLDWTADPGYLPDDLVQAVNRPDVTFMAHGAMFDRPALVRAGLGWAKNRNRWMCTMAAANLHQLPAGLGDLCTALKVPQDLAKSKSGRDLMHLFCKPRPANSTLRRATRHTHPEQWHEFLHEYGRLDIEAMRECWRRMPKVNITRPLVQLYQLDQIINDRGVHIDQELCVAAATSAKRVKADANDLVFETTEGEVHTANQVKLLLEHILTQHGVSLPDMQATTIERRLDDEFLPDEVKVLLAARLAASKNSSAKFTRALQSVCADGRIHGMFAFAAAERTCRWAGRIVQLQNLMRTPKFLHGRLDEAVRVIKADAVDLVYNHPMTVIGACARPMITAAPGRKLVVCDLRNIEGRGLAWEAGEEWRLDAFRALDRGEGDDLYVLSYANSFGVSVDTVKDDEKAGGKMRLIGKVSELQLGYQGAVGAFQSMARIYNFELADKEALRVVKAWRQASPRIVSWWYELDETVRSAISTPGLWFESRCVRIKRDGGWLFVQLPSGRMLCHPGIMIDATGHVSFMGRNRYTRKWDRQRTYGGRWAQAITQSIALDVLAANLPTIEAEGFCPIGTVHDEVITEPPDTSDYTLAMLREIMTQVPPWAKGLPLDAAGYESQFYLKD